MQRHSVGRKLQQVHAENHFMFVWLRLKVGESSTRRKLHVKKEHVCRKLQNFLILFYIKILQAVAPTTVAFCADFMSHDMSIGFFFTASLRFC